MPWVIRIVLVVFLILLRSIAISMIRCVHLCGQRELALSLDAVLI